MKILIMGDLHYTAELVNSDEGLETARDAFYEGYLQQFLSVEADYYISVGDLTHAGLPSEFEFILSRVRSALPEGRFMFVLGNHDTYNLSKSDIERLTGQPRYLAIDLEEATLVLLDTARIVQDNWGGTLDDEQLDWLSGLTSRSGSKPMIVIAHHPVYGTTARSTEPMFSVEPPIDLLSILAAHQGPGFYVNGHNHVRSTVQNGRWHFIQTASVTDVPSAILLELQGDRVTIENIPLRTAFDRERLERFVPAMYDYDPRLDAEGDGEDGRRTLPLAEREKEARRHDR
ncbi:metallophosphoesterase family protein [Cohnella sp. GCM10020058]|uniref:metallophosphoesterase family protein n=1 Tax=Cohnella sp. GCM10020058 TaxID=3317330 RepID=UPI00363D3931